MGRKKLRAVSDKLEGRTAPEALPLSVEGQVLWTIEQATDVSNLSKMYVGWAPWL